MKKYLLSAFILLIITSFTIISFAPVISALKSGNATEVAKYFDSTIEITLPEKSNSYSKKQAELVLQTFFKSINITGFEIIHKSENTGSQYCIGNLNTDNGAYRTTIYMKQKGEKELIQELRFEKQSLTSR